MYAIPPAHDIEHFVPEAIAKAHSKPSTDNDADDAKHGPYRPAKIYLKADQARNKQAQQGTATHADIALFRVAWGVFLHVGLIQWGSPV